MPQNLKAILKTDGSRFALGIGVLYAVLGLLWVIASDAAVSSISSGLIPHSHATKAGQFEFRLSNVSTLVQNQSQKTWYFLRTSPF